MVDGTSNPESVNGKRVFSLYLRCFLVLRVLEVSGKVQVLKSSYLVVLRNMPEDNEHSEHSQAAKTALSWFILFSFLAAVHMYVTQAIPVSND